MRHRRVRRARYRFVPSPGGRDPRCHSSAGCESGAIEAVYLLGADEIDMKRLAAFVVYQGLTAMPGRSAPTSSDRRRLYREGRSTSAPRAALGGAPRDLPPGDPARTEDPAALSVRWAQACLRIVAQLRHHLIEAYPDFVAIERS